MDLREAVRRSRRQLTAGKDMAAARYMVIFVNDYFCTKYVSTLQVSY